MQYMGGTTTQGKRSYSKNTFPALCFTFCLRCICSKECWIALTSTARVSACLKITNGVSPQGDGQYYLSHFSKQQSPWVSLGHKLKPLVSRPHARASRSAYVITAWSTWSTTVRAKEFCCSGPVGSMLSRRICDWVFLHIIYSRVLAMSFLSLQ